MTETKETKETKGTKGTMRTTDNIIIALTINLLLITNCSSLIDSDFPYVPYISYVPYVSKNSQKKENCPIEFQAVPLMTSYIIADLMLAKYNSLFSTC